MSEQRLGMHYIYWDLTRMAARRSGSQYVFAVDLKNNNTKETYKQKH